MYQEAHDRLVDQQRSHQAVETEARERLMASAAEVCPRNYVAQWISFMQIRTLRERLRDREAFIVQLRREEASWNAAKV